MSLHSEQREDGESTSSSSESTETKTDRYGFLLSNGETQNDGSDDLCPELVRHREMKWLNLISQWYQVIEKKTSKIKAQCQKGIPASVRSKCWPLLCGAAERMKKNADLYKYEFPISPQSPSLYKKLESAPGQQSWIDVIKRDTDRQFPFHEMFQSKDGQGQQCLLQVLKAYTEFRPDEGYCQAQGPVAAVLLMNLPTEEAFWCLVQISELYLPGYYSPLLEGVLFDAAILSGVLKKACPTAHKHMQRQGVEPLMFATDWLMCLYSRHLPFNTLLRVWDLFFCYGVRVLFQVAVVLVRRCLGEARQRKECEGQMDTLERLRAVRERVQHEQADAFIQEVCSVHLSLAELQRQTDKEFDKWKKEHPGSTFDPRNRCHGYHMVWEKAREREEKEKENEMKERSSGNLVVPVTRSHSSLSPAVLRKKWRKRGSKVETEEWEGGGRRCSQVKREEVDIGGKRTASVSSTTGELKTDRIPQEFSVQAQKDCNAQPDTQCKSAEEETRSSDLSDKNTPVFEEEEKDTVDSAVVSQEVTITESVGQEEETKVSNSLNEDEAQSPKNGEILTNQDDQDKHQVQNGSETKQETPSRGSSPLEGNEEGDTNAKPEDETLSDEGHHKEEIQPSNVSQEEELQPSNVNQEEELQPSNVSQEEELQLSNVSQEEELQPNTCKQEEELQPNTCKQEEELQPSNVNQEEELHLSNVSQEEELQLSNVSQEEELQPNTCKQEEELQPSNVSQEEELQLSNVNQEEELQPNTCKQEEELQPSNVSQEEELQLSNVSQEEELQPNTCKQEEELQLSNVSQEEELQPNNVSQEEELQPNTCKQEEELQLSTINQEEETENNSCKSEEEIQINASKQEPEIDIKSSKTEEETHPDTTKQGQEIYIKSRTEEMDIQSCICNEPEVYISKQEEDMEIHLTTIPQEGQVNSTEHVEFETHTDIQEREIQLSSCEEKENEEVEIDYKHEEEIRLSSEQEKEISPDSVEEEVEIQPNSNKLQEEKEANYDNDKEEFQECPTVQEDMQEDTELKYEVQEGLKSRTSEEEMVLETGEDGQVQTNVQVTTELHGHESETDGEAPDAEKEGERIIQVSDAPEDGTVMEDQSLNDETSKAAASSTVICVPIQHEPETATSDSQEDSADQQAEENMHGTTITAPEIQPGSTDSEPQLPPNIQVNSLKEELQSVSVPASPVKPTGSSSNPSHPQLRLRRSSSSHSHPTILSEDTFKEPQHGGKDTTQASNAEPEQTPAADTAFQTQALPAQSKADKPKRRGLFHLLKADATTKSSIPKILIQDFSEGEEKLSSRERRRRRREQERKEKEEEKERKRREKELEKEKQKERKKIQTRGRSFQMLSRKHDDNSGPVSSHTAVSKRNSVPYTDGYF